MRHVQRVSVHLLTQAEGFLPPPNGSIAVSGRCVKLDQNQVSITKIVNAILFSVNDVHKKSCQMQSFWIVMNSKEIVFSTLLLLEKKCG